MGKVIAVSNQKGGVAKTTTSINLGVALARNGKRVLLVDADPQGHLSTGLGISKTTKVTLKTMMEYVIMEMEYDPYEAVIKNDEGVDIIPSNKLLSGTDISLITVEERESILKKYLDTLKTEYDYVVIDCMPSLGMLTVNAMAAADSVLIPIEPEYYALDGMVELLRVIRNTKKRYVQVPKDLTRVKTKVMFNLTKRQLVCFGLGGLTAVPVYFLSRNLLGNTMAAMAMILIAMPFFMFAIYEKDGRPLEKILMNMIQVKFKRPGIRPYQTENFYAAIQKEIYEKEVLGIGKENARSSQGQKKRAGKNKG